jgi:hypothetical protein
MKWSHCITFVLLQMMSHSLIPAAFRDLSTLQHPSHNTTSRLIEITNTSLTNTPVTWPTWMRSLCPTVVNHFTTFPYFQNMEGFPVFSSLYAAQAVCTLKIVDFLATSVNSRIYLHAGSHLGSLVHGGPIPWDDDVDVLMPFSSKDRFLKRCGDMGPLHGNTTLKCVVTRNAIKVAVMTEETLLNHLEPWPFVDLFLFKVLENHIVEVTPTGYYWLHFRLDKYFPTLPTYFGGVMLFAPQPSIAYNRYNISMCRTGSWNHRKERRFNGTAVLDCAMLSHYFPFVYRTATTHNISNGRNTVNITPPIAVQSHFAISVWNTSRRWRQSSCVTNDRHGQRLTNEIPNINSVEIDNTISTNASSFDSLGNLTVVEWNACRGKHWLYAIELLQPLNADVIILNEMDIGMARSDQQHTTRLLAYALGMNYAWGLEFLELTRGDAEEQELTTGMINMLGLHGNAILSRYPIVNATIFRDPIESYFSSLPSFLNANGYERRLGGRMALLGKIFDGTNYISVGSIHKVFTRNTQIQNYIGSSKAIVGGDQPWGFCTAIGLQNIGSHSNATWPASCASTGRGRGDILCTNLDVYSSEKILKPCIMFPCAGNRSNQSCMEINLSDHALLSINVSFKSK